MGRVTSEMYLQMWLSEQIPTNEWIRILENRIDVKKMYDEHLKSQKQQYFSK